MIDKVELIEPDMASELTNEKEESIAVYQIKKLSFKSSPEIEKIIEHSNKWREDSKFQWSDKV